MQGTSIIQKWIIERITNDFFPVLIHLVNSLTYFPFRLEYHLWCCFSVPEGCLLFTLNSFSPSFIGDSLRAKRDKNEVHSIRLIVLISLVVYRASLSTWPSHSWGERRRLTALQICPDFDEYLATLAFSNEYFLVCILNELNF